MFTVDEGESFIRFGDGDLDISDHPLANSKSTSFLGGHFERGTKNPRTELAGAKSFQLKNIIVITLIPSNSD